MSTNNVSAVLAPEDLQTILTDIDTIEKKLDFLTSATNRDKRAKQLMGTSSIGFVQYGLATAKNNIDILSRSFSVEEYQKDVDLLASLQQVYNRLIALVQKLKDTLSLLGQDLMDQANEVYSAVKREAKTHGNLKAVADEMGKRYEVSRKEEPVEAKNPANLN